MNVNFQYTSSVDEKITAFAGVINENIRFFLYRGFWPILFLLHNIRFALANITLCIQPNSSIDWMHV